MVVRARLLALPAIVVCVLALAPTSALGLSLPPACGHANTNNPGLHMGLFKNGCLTLPAPAPSPPPVVAGLPAGLGNAQGAIPALIVPAVASQVPTQVRRGHRQPSYFIPSQQIAPAIPWSDRNLWIITALLPSLLVLWLLIAGRAAADALQKRRGPIVSVA